MSSRKFIGEKDSDVQDDEQRAEPVEEEPELRPTVELRTQAKIDSEAIAKVDGVADHPYGMTLADEEKWAAREAEKARTREREDRGQGRFRERLCRDMTETQCGRTEPVREDPMAQFGVDQQREIRKQAMRLSGRVDGSLGHTAIERLLARRVADGDSLPEAVLAVLDELYETAGAVVPIGKLETVRRREVSVEGRIAQLWTPSHPRISQVGLIADESGQTRFTAWKASDVRAVAEGERVRFRAAAKNWYDGRVSIALTGESRVEFPERSSHWLR